MHKPLSPAVLLAFTVVVASAPRLALADSLGCQFASSIPLTLQTAPVSRPGWPLTTGVPFPKGLLGSTDQLRLEDGAGREVSAQFGSLARWPDGSQKSVLVSLVAPVTNGPPSSYTLHWGPGVTRATYGGVLVSEDASRITVSTGPIQFQVSKVRFGLFNQVWVDSNRNGIFESAERVVAASPGDIWIVDAFSGKTYSSSLDPSPRVTVLERGPIRAVIQATGTLRSAAGDGLTEYRVWMTAWAGSDVVQVDNTLVDPRPETNVQAPRTRLALALSQWGVRQPFQLASPRFAFGGEGEATYAGALTADRSLYQGGSTNYVDGNLQPYTFAYDGAGTGQKAPGWVDVSGASAGITVAVRDFWQQFPKQFNLRASGVLEVELHPARASGPLPDLAYPALDGTTKRYVRPNTFYAAREGSAKTYQLLFSFHAGAASVSRPADANQLFQLHRPLLAAPSAWYAGSGVFGRIVEAGPWSAGYDASLLDGIYTPSVAATRDTGGLAMPYGWGDYGDRMRGGWEYVSPAGVRVPGFYNDSHLGGGHNFLVQYLRTLDARWWELGEIATRHWMDRDVSHANRAGYWSPANGFGPGESYSSGHNVIDHHSQAMHVGHAHISGLPDLYLLTGDRRAREVLDEVGGWWVRAAAVFYPTPLQRPHYAEASRDFGRPLFTLNESFRATGDVRYLKAAAGIVKHLIAWWQTPADHLQAGKVVGRHDWTQGTGWITMAPHCDNCPDGWNGTSGPWMDGDMLSDVIDFYEHDRDSGLVHPRLVQEFLLQVLDYDVKWGYVEPAGGTPYFAYAECQRATDGGNSTLLHPLAYIGRMWAQGAGMNRAWYRTAPKWLAIAGSAYADLKQVRWRGSTSSGFYGYELVPTEFFAIERDLVDGVGPDTDGDGIPDRVEGEDGTNASVKDNDVFNDACLFAQQQARDFLGREGDTAGTWSLSRALDAGSTTRPDVVKAFLDTAEFQNGPASVARLYFAAFTRAPDHGGLTYWLGWWKGGTSLDAIAQVFAASPEFVARYGTLNNKDFVTRIFQNVLGRAPEAAGLAYWKGQLDTGALTRGQVLARFSESAEFRKTSYGRIFVTEMFEVLLRRSTGAGVLASWAPAIDAGASTRPLVQAFLDAAEYRQRFLP